MRIRDVKPEDLLPPKAKPRPLTPRQLANAKRRAVVAKALEELRAGPDSRILRVELEPGEKLTSIRLAIAAQLKESASPVKVAVRNGAIYLSRGIIPGGRRTSAGR